jgi:choline kinase
LAAGRGALGDSTPKWLLPVGGRTIADRHLEGLRDAAEHVASTSVVVGHAADAIIAELGRRPGDDVVAVRNPEYATLNNWWSVLRALRELPEHGPVVIVNADLLVDPEHVAGFLEAAAIGSADGLLAVDLERTLTDESMKVARRPGGTLDRIGKAGIDDAAGEYIGMLMARGPALHALRQTLESFVGRADCQDEWYEGAVGRTAAAGIGWDIWPMPSSAWVEIDDDGDLARAEGLVGAR